ncbi:hypothetical protein A3A54_00190 [Candidatus Curtissbacteria bacterium RIFCSPLOWO2_01_FULL_39_62]|uniref:Uncharacterized protein n=2 Tax=Candidatus Curtissiibacteriota TaxID=1752717 RepID=A0A1F5GAQ7_9BACT|nr:MAG: hypothetical protein A2775_00890 [Candidatus Curtissbacteria bacterium RIFCSPHIGHO2_01_FULL_39_57]OGD88936.1 MAG: hypothetical protein A3D04_01940 [Candidatus Curtissbacteria bacterium RIFCSPHIGHO2_02_FULL_40_16b]OGD90686.1 MAG: hypothetical protein A3E11_00935 [Candidatus Curtissbacteria bacterium RIFCSPHIGHO2_12_FULL_38_37]OGE00725.1 MAG: hypothetical protein A3J17_04195 [Candidatus Curtissbacteria bacterium RIFCSPLOWO2_02_FULL_40_11]OGE02435.1 MAG: hypothetical protein A3A54_00190 [C
MEQAAEKVQTTGVIELDSLFTFFENAKDSGGLTTTETRSVNRIGELLGEATKLEVEGHPEINRKVVNFQIEAIPAKKEGGARNHQTIEGEPGERLVMFAALPDGRIFGSFRELVDQNVSRIIKFTQWYQIDNTNNKQELIKLSQSRKGSSLTVDGTELTKVKYLLK